MKHKKHIFKSGRCPRRYSVELENRILNLYDDGLSATKIAKKLNKQTTAIVRVLKRNGRKICTNKGPDHPNWKGGRGIKCGYWTVYNPTHPRAMNIRRVYEHILVMEKHLKRYISKTEPIHHIDFDRLNNEITNLYLCKNNSQHQQLKKSANKVFSLLVKKGVIKFINGEYTLKTPSQQM